MFYSNIGEALITKGLARVIRYRQDDDQRSLHYDELLSAEAKAEKTGAGLHNKKQYVSHRVAEVTGVSERPFVTVIHLFLRSQYRTYLEVFNIVCGVTFCRRSHVTF